MGAVSGFVTYFLIWWVVLFTQFSIGLRADADGTPANPDIKKKFLMTSLIALGIFGIVYALIESDLISFQDIADQWMQEDYGTK